MNVTALPKDANRVFGGILFDIYQRQQEMLDGTFQTFECAVRNDVVQVIMVDNGKILLARQVQPTRGEYISLFGGMMNDDEQDPYAAILRELNEEAGIVPKSLELWHTLPHKGKIVYTDYFYIARGIKEQRQQHLDAGGEYIELYAVTFDEFLGYLGNERFFVRDQFQLWLITTYILTGKQEELRQLLGVM